jgi:sulfate/thiosulfate transport system permease protein
VAARVKKRSILPGFGLTMGYTMVYVSLIVIIPLIGLFLKSATMSWADMKDALTDPDLIASLKLTFGASLLAALFNAVFGFIVAWTLVRYTFPGRRFVDGLIDLPFALPTAVSGITLATLYAHNGWLGNLGGHVAGGVNAVFNAVGGHRQLLSDTALSWINLDFAYTRMGILIALVFIGMPFVVRSLQPALEELDPEVEEAAASLGASTTQSFFRVVLPALLPALLTGFSLAFARAIGEYGSVIFISDNIPGKTEITAHLIMKKLENNDYAGATMLGVVMLVVSFLMLAAINGLQWWSTRMKT